MRVHKISLQGFRNYVNLTMEFTRNINIFIGPNAQGKTNLLEALYFGAMGRSHRASIDRELINWEQQTANIEILFSRRDVENRLKIKLINNQNKEILYNDHPLPAREIVGSLTAVLFSPEDLLLIKGAPALRRRFLDNEISQANPAYYRQLINYNRILGHRNNLLKKIKEKKANADMLEAWDEQLAKTAGYLTAKRQQVIKQLAMLANLHHRKLTDNKENLAAAYYLHGLESGTVSDLTGWYRSQLAKLRQEDIWKGNTGIGPHRDDLILSINGKNLRIYGSQGQQRTGVLSLKLAELEFIKSETGEYPILLLDDVMSELDAGRRLELLLFIKERIQTFITTTEEKYFPDHKIGKFYKIMDGTVIG
ncbi:MAG TPA: DNA replication/repair protein RecF [Methylomusa anaerophila]|uniref:DNA replication and repair protein RecF n=1 Tax=Methylomusa anaerophila TaxID=1930071 RepID=A0A348AHL8_9FIRM|nr:DNA replication/repair protein RecF [Methylomusa anaerophila]BBB90566.1 DNA replication and repair protein RecF [Methylomusa anaerophila]HML88828.1 DNA replication/repair protein RecF [Methylomusa anaerophila]